MGRQEIEGHILADLTPTDYPIPGRTVVYDAGQTIDLENVPLGGGILLKTLVLSIDPYLRGRMRDSSIKSYSVSHCHWKPMQSVVLIIRDLWLACFPAGTAVRVVPVSKLHSEYNMWFARLENYGVGIVIRSENPAFNARDHVYGTLREYLL